MSEVDCKYHAHLLDRAEEEIESLRAQLAEAERERDEALAEVQEQARLLGMGSEREARLIAERDEARAENERLRAVLCAAAEPFRADYPDEWRAMAAHRLKTLRAALGGEVE